MSGVPRSVVHPPHWFAGSGGMMSHFSTVERTREPSRILWSTQKPLLMESPEGGDINRLKRRVICWTRKRYQPPREVSLDSQCTSHGEGRYGSPALDPGHDSPIPKQARSLDGGLLVWLAYACAGGNWTQALVSVSRGEAPMVTYQSEGTPTGKARTKTKRISRGEKKPETGG